jgi:hypothetical protein
MLRSLCLNRLGSATSNKAIDLEREQAYATKDIDKAKILPPANAGANVKT